MPETTQVLQLRISPDLYTDLAAEVERRKGLGEKASLNAVAIEWMQKGAPKRGRVRHQRSG